MDTVFTPYEQKYMKVIEKLRNTFLKKNHDYGSSVKKNYDKFELYGYNEGLKYVFGRISEKYDRLENLIYNDHPNQVLDESIMDTLLDMANYAILAAVSYDEHHSELPDLAFEKYKSLNEINKQDFKSSINEYINKQDFKSSINEYINKQDFKSSIDEYINKQNSIDNFNQFKNKMDKLCGEKIQTCQDKALSDENFSDIINEQRNLPPINLCPL